MGKLKNEHFNEISFNTEKAKFERYLSALAVSELSIVYLINKSKGKFNLSEEDLLTITRNYFRF